MEHLLAIGELGRYLESRIRKRVIFETGRTVTENDVEGVLRQRNDGRYYLHGLGRFYGGMEFDLIPGDSIMIHEMKSSLSGMEFYLVPYKLV